MQQVELELREDYEFFCPVTGKQILFEDDFIASPAMVFNYVDLEGGFFAFANDWLKNIIIELGLNIGDEGWVGYEDFDKIRTAIINTVETKNYVCFSITTRGMACGPRSSTAYICIDMGYKPEEKDK